MSAPAPPHPAIDEADTKARYVKEKNLHHLFELLASRVLTKRPDNIFQFLRDELQTIEQVETKSRSHDPSAVTFAAPAAAPISAAPAAGSPAGSPTSSSPPKNPLAITIAVLGIQNAGKSAIIAAMGGNPDRNTQPTIGFAPVHFNTDALNVCVFDLGGGSSFRGIWPHYFHDVLGVIYVVDSADEALLPDAAKAFADVAGHKYIHGKPLLIFANKKDVPGAKTAAEIKTTLFAAGPPSLEAEAAPQLRVMSSCAVEHDADVDAGVDWLLNTISNNHAALVHRTHTDTAEVKAEKAKRLAEQRARVEQLQREDAAKAAAAAAGK